LELTPRTTEAAPDRRGRNVGATIVILVVLVTLGFIVYKGLSNATLYFKNADEALAEREDLGTRRFRLQGTVVGEPDPTDEGVSFAVAFNGERVQVHHAGDPPELFAPGIPVVLEGRWSADGGHYESDKIMVKHSAEYEAENEDRLRDAEDGADAPVEP
jgi:cytochrome c-type biogenesis protein CcmE